jgi:predicted  nucleic acid-binding Zn-ribbon protein
MDDQNQVSDGGQALERKSGKQVKKPAPADLADYLQGGAPAASYVTALVERKARALDEDERALGVKLIKAHPELLPRLVELARASLSKAVSSRVKKDVTRLSSDVIRSQDEALADWFRLAGSAPDAEVGKLARHLQRARDGAEKDAQQRAEHLLQLGVAIMSGQDGFQTIGALAEIHAKLVAVRKGSKSANTTDLVQRALARASVKSLEAFSAINAIATEALLQAREQHSAINAQLIGLQDRVRDQREKIDRQTRELEALKDEKAALAENLKEVRAQISGVAGGRDADLNALRARYRQLLSANLAELVTQAHEAITAAPPAPEIAEVLLDDAAKAINKELEWLRQFLV